MKLIVSDKRIGLPELDQIAAEFIDLPQLKIENCIGCVGCWIKTPGRCVIRDDAVKVYPIIAQSNQVMYISKVRYGGYDTPMKTMLERAIPIQQAFLRLLDGETHHVQRSVVPKEAVIVGYGDLAQDEKNLFCQLIKRNQKNMNFKSCRIVFSSEEKLEETVKREVLLWKK